MMRKSKRTELRALREVAHFLLPLLCCEFCGKPLLDPERADKIFGNKAHTPLNKLGLCVHHRNGKHSNNTRMPTIGQDSNGVRIFDNYRIVAICGNTSLTHRKCHCQHELKLRREREKLEKRK